MGGAHSLASASWEEARGNKELKEREALSDSVLHRRFLGRTVVEIDPESRGDHERDCLAAAPRVSGRVDSP